MESNDKKLNQKIHLLLHRGGYTPNTHMVFLGKYGPDTGGESTYNYVILARLIFSYF